MVRACLVFPLVMIVCVGSAIALKCYQCGYRGSTSCDMTKPGDEVDCDAANDQKRCYTLFDPNGSLLQKYCMSDLNYDGTSVEFTIQVGKCFANPQNNYTSCWCETDKCNGASKKDEASKEASSAGGGGSSSTKPVVWINLLWIGLILASAFYSSMPAV